MSLLRVFTYFLILYGISTHTLLAYVIPKTIAITQITSHPTLDLVRRGIEDTLANEGYDASHGWNIDYENPQGDLGTAAQIAQKFAASKPAVVIAITTPSAQIVAKALKKTNIPLIFTSVTDPIAAQLVQDLEHPSDKITGTRNPVAIEPNLRLIRESCPNANSLGIILNYGEVNSVKALEKLKLLAPQFGFSVKPVGINKVSDIQQAFNSLSKKVDCILLQQDNTLASASASLIHMSIEAGIPIFATYMQAVKEGAVGGVAPEEYGIGVQTAKMAIKVLKGKDLSKIPVEDPEHRIIGVNLDTARELNIIFPTEVLRRTDIFYEKDDN